MVPCYRPMTKSCHIQPYLTAKFLKSPRISPIISPKCLKITSIHTMPLCHTMCHYVSTATMSYYVEIQGRNRLHGYTTVSTLYLPKSYTYHPHRNRVRGYTPCPPWRYRGRPPHPNCHVKILHIIIHETIPIFTATARYKPIQGNSKQLICLAGRQKVSPILHDLICIMTHRASCPYMSPLSVDKTADFGDTSEKCKFSQNNPI